MDLVLHDLPHGTFDTYMLRLVAWLVVLGVKAHAAVVFVGRWIKACAVWRLGAINRSREQLKVHGTHDGPMVGGKLVERTIKKSHGTVLVNFRTISVVGQRLQQRF